MLNLAIGLLAIGTTTFASPIGQAKTDAQLTLEHRDGLRDMTFPTPNGSIKVYLPADIMAGDTITGTVVALPKEAGKPASDELSGYVVELGPASEKKSGAYRTWDIAKLAGLTGLYLQDRIRRTARSWPDRLWQPILSGPGCRWRTCFRALRFPGGPSKFKAPSTETLGTRPFAMALCRRRFWPNPPAERSLPDLPGRWGRLQ